MIKDKSLWLDSFRTKSKSALVLAVCSGKGGVGKTSVSLKLAQMYAQSSKKVLLVDCDFNLSNSAIKLGLALNDNFLKVIKNPHALHQYVDRSKGFDLLPGCNGDVEVLESRYLITRSVIDILGMYSHYYDLIILDSPAGASKDSLNLIALADYRLFVVTPEPSSITDSYSLFKLSTEHFGCSNNLMIVNRYQEEKQWMRVKTVMLETTQKFAKDSFVFLGAIPELTVSHGDFDRCFLETADSSLSKSFSNIKNNFDEMILSERLVDLKEKLEKEDNRLFGLI